MEPIVVKSKGFMKIAPIYLGLGVIATLVAAILLILRKFEIWVYIIGAIGVSGLLATLLVVFLDKKLPACYIARQGDKLVFENGFTCAIREVDLVFCKKSSLYITVGENAFCYQFVSEAEATCKKLNELIEEYK